VLIEGISTKLIAITVLLSSVVGHFGYVGLKLDRSMRRELKAAADKARDEENRRLGEQIAQLDRQRSLGEMSASLGHELNQPLTAILTNAQVAKRGLQAGRFQVEQFTEFLDKIIQNTQRASQIIERIRGFIRPTATRSEPVDLTLIVREVAELIAAEARSHKVALVFADQASPLLVAGDPIQISQIVLNVLRNAIEALQQVAHREIHIVCLRADGQVVLRIRDSGPGLAPEVLAQVGSPFFTTKSSGLGMGISISRSIAVQHGGTLSITNAEGGGAVVELKLPALPEGRP
jgi:C4-dicarboxylate-specific signal transduction histidine kinase